MLILHPTDRFLRNVDRDIFYNKLANAVVHVSVQLFSNENLALLLCDRLKLLYIIIISLKFAIEGNRKNYWGILVPNLLLNPHYRHLELKNSTNNNNSSTTSATNNNNNSSSENFVLNSTLANDNDCDDINNTNVNNNATKNQDLNSEVIFLPRVVSCDHLILRYHRFWPIVSDLNNLFTHERIALSFLEDDTLIDLWLEFIMSFQAMNLNRKFNEVDQDSVSYKAAYLSELEICASQMWTLISHLKNEVCFCFYCIFLLFIIFLKEKFFKRIYVN